MFDPGMMERNVRTGVEEFVEEVMDRGLVGGKIHPAAG